MKVVALISGGKDSCFNMMHCIANGHDIVALANLRPLKQHEIDSYMYQTVGHDVIHLYEEAMNLPLYREFITGTSVDQSITYHQTLNDETEDLYRLLKRVKDLHPSVNAVSVGAILSNYQRTRVENVCKRLNLVCLAYLWKRNQEDLLKEMISQNLHAIIIKVATLGLNKSHLGKSLVEIMDHLLEMNKRYNIHICGEGGEYETLVLDCPIFQKRIKIIESETIDHSSGDVAYLKFIAKIEEKPILNTNWKKKIVLPNKLNGEYQQLKKYLENSNNEKYNENYIVSEISIKEENNFKIFPNFLKLENLVAIGGINAHMDSVTLTVYTLEEEFHYCMNKLKEYLKYYDLNFCDIVVFELILKKMDYISVIDTLYSQYFNFSKPPPRICINCDSLKFNRLQISVLADFSHKKRFVIHVQSQNYWIPANTSFSSHAIMTEGIVFVAGQIGIIPSTMYLPYPKSFLSEVIVSLQNLERIVKSMEIFNISCIAFVSNNSHILLTSKAWRYSSLYNDNCLIILVNNLSYGALIEWHLIGKKREKMICDEEVRNNSWSVLHSTFKIHENMNLSLEIVLESLLESFKGKNLNNKVLSSTIYYNIKSFQKIKSLEIISKAILHSIHSILGYTVEVHCISTNGIWLSKEAITPVLMAMKIIYLSL